MKETWRNEIRQSRDELKLKAHLFKAETKDAWEKVEQKWHKLEGELGPSRKAAHESWQNISEANKLLVEEIKDGIKKIKDSM